MSGGKDMFNLFLTFSLADLHEPLLHEKLPEEYTKDYLNKTQIFNIMIVQNLFFP